MRVAISLGPLRQRRVVGFPAIRPDEGAGERSTMTKKLLLDADRVSYMLERFLRELIEKRYPTLYISDTSVPSDYGTHDVGFIIGNTDGGLYAYSYINVDFDTGVVKARLASTGAPWIPAAGLDEALSICKQAMEKAEAAGGLF